MKNLRNKIIIAVLSLVLFASTANAGNVYFKNGVLNITGDTYVGKNTFYVNTTSSSGESFVGIGTVKPEQALQVVGNIMLSGMGKLIQQYNPDTHIWFILYDHMKFFVGGKYLLDLYEGDQDYVKLGDGTDVDINLNDKMFVNGYDGFIGMGTTNPVSKLNVVGEVNITGISNDGTGKIVCIKSNGELGTCIDDPTSGMGTCTCS